MINLLKQKSPEVRAAGADALSYFMMSMLMCMMCMIDVLIEKSSAKYLEDFMKH